MEYRTLGKTGLKISRLGFGGIPIQHTSAETTRTLIEKLMEVGVNYIDTARVYTVSEEYLGYALEGVRDQFILATKSMARTKEAMEKDIATSLKNLRTDYIDLYQVHNPMPAELDQVIAPGGALEALREAKAAGKIGHIGITLHSADTLARAIEMDWVETVMFPYNIVETQGEDLIRACAEKNIGFIVMKPLAGGAIDDARLALRFVCANAGVTVVIPGMESETQIHENLAAVLDSSPLTEEEKAKMEEFRKALGTQFCRRCNYCAPCTAGISIFNMFLIEGYYKRYNLVDWANAKYDALPKHASDCIGCGVCETRCPYNLPIRKMLKNVEALMGR